MTDSTVAERYARALFEIGAQGGEEKLAGLGSALNGLSDAMRTSSDLQFVLANPVVTSREKEQVLARVLTGLAGGEPLDAETLRVIKNFCGLLAEKNRLSIFGSITRSFNAMHDARLGIVRGTLCTAIELDEHQQQSITSRLEQSTGQTLALEYQTDPAILGGVTVRLGDRVLDASLRTQLELLRDTIRKGE